MHSNKLSPRKPSPNPGMNRQNSRLMRRIIIGVAVVTLLICLGVYYTRPEPRVRVPTSFVVGAEYSWAMNELEVAPSDNLYPDEVADIVRSHRAYLDHRMISGSDAHARDQCELVHFRVNYRHKDEAPEELKIEYIRIPPMTRNRTAVLLVLHGCGHTAKDFCEASAACPGCLGLAEEQKYVGYGLAMGLEVIAVSSPNHGSHCWANSRVVKRKENSDQYMWNNRDLFAILQVLKREEILGTTIPLIVGGASSGGAALSMLPAVLGHQMYAAIPHVAAPSFPLRHRPPVVFYSVMANDGPLLERAVQEQMAISSDGVTRTGLKVFHPIELTPFVFADRIAGFPSMVSRDIVQALYDDSNMVNPATRMIKVNPRNSRKTWVPLIRKVLDHHLSSGHWSENEKRLLKDSLVADASSIAEQMNVLFGVHEFLGEPSKELLRSIIKYAK